MFFFSMINYSAVEFVLIVDLEHLALAHHQDGMHITQCVIRVINKETKVSHVPFVKELIERQLTEKWSNVLRAISMLFGFIFVGIILYTFY